VYPVGGRQVIESLGHLFSPNDLLTNALYRAGNALSSHANKVFPFYEKYTFHRQAHCPWC
jgi:hypothetical protein